MSLVKDDGRASRSRQIIGLVAGREIRERGGNKAFLISTTILVLGVVAAVVVPKVIGSNGPQTFRVGVVGQPSPSLASTLQTSAAALSAKVRIRDLPSHADGEAALRAQTIDLLVASPDGLLIRGDKTSEQVKNYANLLARTIPVERSLQAAGIPPSQVPSILSPRPLAVRNVVPPKASADASRGLIFLGTLVLYLSLVTYGSWVGFGVTEEKGSRVVEVLVSTIRPYHLLAGKVIGIGLLGLGQLTLVAGAGLIAAAAVGNHLPSSTPGAIVLLLLLFVLGFAFYSCAYAAVGASVSRQEDVQNGVAPISLLLVVGYLLSIGGVANPDSTLMRIASFIPPLAPLTVPARMILGHPSPWELPLSIAITATSAYGLIRLGGRMYSGALLRFGERVKLRQAYRSGFDRVRN